MKRRGLKPAVSEKPRQPTPLPAHPARPEPGEESVFALGQAHLRQHLGAPGADSGSALLPRAPSGDWPGQSPARLPSLTHLGTGLAEAQKWQPANPIK